MHARFNLRSRSMAVGAAQGRLQRGPEPPVRCGESLENTKPPQFLMVSCAKCGSTALYEDGLCKQSRITCAAKRKASVPHPPTCFASEDLSSPGQTRVRSRASLASVVFASSGNKLAAFLSSKELQDPRGIL